MQGKDDHILKLPVTLMRGGTSKGVYLLEEDLPERKDLNYYDFTLNEKNITAFNGKSGSETDRWFRWFPICYK